MPAKYDAFEKNPANYVPLSPLSLIRRTASVFPDRTAVIHGRGAIPGRKHSAAAGDWPQGWPGLVSARGIRWR